MENNHLTLSNIIRKIKYEMRENITNLKGLTINFFQNPTSQIAISNEMPQKISNVLKTVNNLLQIQHFGL